MICKTNIREEKLRTQKKYSGIRDAKILCKSSLWKNSRVEGKFSKEGKNIKKIITILIEKK